jgi:2'-5' RNA ligase
MRLFIALNLPKKERQRIHRAARPLRDEGLPVRWVDPDNFHVTLKFLGQVRPDRMPQVEEVMGRVASATTSFKADFGGFGAFPTIRRPRVVWLGVDPSAELRCLKQDIEWGLADLGFEAETRAFHPHLTLGRANAGDGAGAFRGLDEIVADMGFRGEIHIRSIDLMRSHLSKEGARYSIVTSAKLAAP